MIAIGESLTQTQLAKRAARAYGVDEHDPALALARATDLVRAGLIVRGSDGLYRRPEHNPEPQPVGAKQPEPPEYWVPAHVVTREVQIKDEAGKLRTISVQGEIPEHRGPWGAAPDQRPRVRVRNCSTRLPAHVCGVRIKPGQVAEIAAEDVAKISNIENLGCVIEPPDDERQDVSRRRSRRRIFGGR